MNNLYLSDTSIDKISLNHLGGGIKQDKICTYVNYAIIAYAIYSGIILLTIIVGIIKDEFHMNSEWVFGLSLWQWCSSWLSLILCTGAMALFVNMKCIGGSDDFSDDYN